MEPDHRPAKKRLPFGKIVLWTLGIILFLLLAGGIYLYTNVNKLLSDALRKSFNNSLVSDVYALEFSNLSVNFLGGNISVHDVDLRPLDKPLVSYPYINSTLHLKAGKILLGNVQIKTLLKENILILDEIELVAPEINFNITDATPIFFPFHDTTSAAAKPTEKRKKSISKYFLKEFSMVDAAFRVSNTAAERQFNIERININLKELLLDQQPGIDVFSYKKIDFSIGTLDGSMKQSAVRHIRFSDYTLSIDSLKYTRTKDTAILHFADLRTGIRELGIDTKDSTYHVSVQSFELSYRDHSINTKGLAFKPNISEAALQAKQPYQHATISGTLGSLQVEGLNFDSLLYGRKLFADRLLLDSLSVSIYKDKTKPLDKKRFPVYLGQTIAKIDMPIHIQRVNARNLSLVSREKKPDGSPAAVHISRGTAEISNITNLRPNESLTMKADAYLEHKGHFNATLRFSYASPQFSFEGRMNRLNLADLNPLLKSYTPAHINKGVLDDLNFSGLAHASYAKGSMKFLYHDLDIDLALKNQEKWKSSLLSFAANTVLPSANPKSAEVPARIVKYRVERAMNKGFINILIKSLLAGLKETMIMSKENRQEYKKARKEARKNKK